MGISIQHIQRGDYWIIAIAYTFDFEPFLYERKPGQIDYAFSY